MRYAPDKPITAIIKTRNRVKIFKVCTIVEGRLSKYQVSFDLLLHFQNYAPDKLNIARIRKKNNSINTDDWIMILTFCTFPDSFLSVYQVSFIYLQYF